MKPGAYTSLLALLAYFLSMPVISFAQETQDCGESPYGLSPLEIYSIFSESARTGDYFTALLYGPHLICAHPYEIDGFPQYDGPSTHKKMIDVYESFAETKKDPSERSTYLDSSLVVFELMFHTYDSTQIDYFDLHLRRGRFLQRHSDFIDNALQRMYADYEAAFNLNHKKAIEQAKGYYIKVVLANMVGTSRKEEALALIEASKPYANEDLNAFFDQQLNSLFSDPTERIGFLEGKMNAEPDNLEILNELFDLYLREDMLDDAKDIARKLYELNPNFVNTLRLAENASSNANYQDAIKFYKETLEKAEEDEQKYEVSLKLAETYINLENLQQARRYAREASKMNSDAGQPYMIIARAYTQAVSTCGGSKLNRIDKAVYWLVLDYYDIAKRKNADLATSVDRQANTIKQVIPTAEEKFYQNWTSGDKIKIDGSLKECYGWINESTTVR